MLLVKMKIEILRVCLRNRSRRHETADFQESTLCGRSCRRKAADLRESTQLGSSSADLRRQLPEGEFRATHHSWQPLPRSCRREAADLRESTRASFFVRRLTSAATTDWAFFRHALMAPPSRARLARSRRCPLLRRNCAKWYDSNRLPMTQSAPPSRARLARRRKQASSCEVCPW